MNTGSRESSGEYSATTWRMSDDFFSTFTPCRRTSSGSLASAACTLLLTLMVAWSGSVPTLKYTVRVMAPLASELDSW
ncbi:hypothetical protein D3C76_652020 [compost metagenome]